MSTIEGAAPERRRLHAKRMDDVEASGTVKTTDIVNRLKAEGKEIVSFSIGEPDFITPKHIRDAATRALDAGFTHYTSSYGIPELREAIAKKSVSDNGIPCEAKHVLVTPAKQAIFEAIFATVDPGDEVIIPDPGWVSYEPIIKLAGGVPVHVKVEAHKDFRQMPDDIGRAVTPKTKMIIVNSPSNPTGSVATESDVKGVAEIAKSHDLLVLSDEIYEKIIYEGKHHSIAAEHGMMERTITVNGLSKSYAMTGWRIGWLVAPLDILTHISKIQQHSITHVTSFAQKAAVTALTASQRSVADMAAEFKTRRDLVVEGLNAIPGMHCVKPKGAFYVFPRFDYEMSSEELSTYILSEAGVAVTPGSAFGPNGEHHLRISYANSQENLRKGLDRMREALGKLKE
ncbi:MAG: pyridoxal phosphate-dependent aminotransferase [Euryarchaeota archaeon]|nr:pyridoxal phosphate-dependent aminotransferase [Euryarchaeota archaeon]